MDERDRDWRERDWRRSEALGRGRYGRGEGEGRRSGEPSRWDEERYERPARSRRGYADEDDDYRARSRVSRGGAYGRESYAAGRPEGRAEGYAYESGRYGWQRPRFTSQDYTGRGYDEEAARGRYGERGRRGEAEWDEAQAPRESRSWEAERGYGEARRRWEEREGGDFLQRAGERIGSWFRSPGDEPPRGREDLGRSHRGLGPKGYQRSDERINEEVHDRLTDDPWLDASNVQVAVNEAEVTLSGHVESREGKHRAERLIEDISGVRHVQNNLRVEPAVLTGAGRGYGSSALEAEMRRNEPAAGAAETRGRPRGRPVGGSGKGPARR
jgi:osmotically-inducible protein OsmY